MLMRTPFAAAVLWHSINQRPQRKNITPRDTKRAPKTENRERAQKEAKQNVRGELAIKTEMNIIFNIVMLVDWHSRQAARTFGTRALQVESVRRECSHIRLNQTRMHVHGALHFLLLVDSLRTLRRSIAAQTENRMSRPQFDSFLPAIVQRSTHFPLLSHRGESVRTRVGIHSPL